MAIANDWYVDYQNKLIAHSPSNLAYTPVSSTFNNGETITWSGATESAIIVLDDSGTSMDIINATTTPSGTITGSVTGATATTGALTTKTATYLTRGLYSFLQDTFDESDQMDDAVPMQAQTPTEFTMINGWYVDEQSTKFLTGGAIATSGWDAVSNDNGIRVIYINTTTTAATPDDIGLGVTQATTGDTGTLLSYDNTAGKWWVRVDATTDVFSTNDAITVDAGNGDIVPIGASTKTGDDLWANIYTLGTLELTPKPQIYIFQSSESLAEWWGLGNAYAHIDVLVKVKASDQLTDNGYITVFVRQFGDLYDNFLINLTSGGRQAVPLATATDLNNIATGEIYLLYDNRAGGTFSANDIITGATNGATAEITSVSDFTGVGYLVIGNLKGTIDDNEEISNGTATADANGTVGDTLLTYTVGTDPTTLDQIMTGGSSGAQRKLKGIETTTATNYLVMLTDVTAEADIDYYKIFTEDETVTGASDGSVTALADSTTLVAGYADTRIWFTNGAISVAASASFTVGLTVTGGTGSQTGVVMEITDGTTLLLGNVTGDWDANVGQGITDTGSGTSTTTAGITEDSEIDKAFSQDTTHPYDIIINCGGRSLSEVYEWIKYVTREDANSNQINNQTMYPATNNSGTITLAQLDGEEYISAQVSPADPVYAPVKASPFGTLAGGTLFAARGVWIENMHGDDAQAFQLLDSDGITRTPPNFQNFTVTNVAADDTVGVFKTTAGSSTVIDKTMYTSHASNNTSGATQFEITDDIPLDTPSAGYIRIVDISDSSVNREIRYQYDSWSESTFDLTGGVTLDRGYTDVDTAYAAYIDSTASGTSVTEQVIFVSERPVVCRVRHYDTGTPTVDSILPFETTGTFSSTGYSSAAIRTKDSIVT